MKVKTITKKSIELERKLFPSQLSPLKEKFESGLEKVNAIIESGNRRKRAVYSLRDRFYVTSCHSDLFETESDVTITDCQWSLDLEPEEVRLWRAMILQLCPTVARKVKVYMISQNIWVSILDTEECNRQEVLLYTMWMRALHEAQRTVRGWYYFYKEEKLPPLFSLWISLHYIKYSRTRRPVFGSNVDWHVFYPFNIDFDIALGKKDLNKRNQSFSCEAHPPTVLSMFEGSQEKEMEKVRMVESLLQSFIVSKRECISIKPFDFIDERKVTIRTNKNKDRDSFLKGTAELLKRELKL